MSRVYRGYPQGIWKQNELEMIQQKMKLQSLEPYMIYDREAQTSISAPLTSSDKKKILSEYEYFRALYPMAIKQWQRLVEEEFDRYDQPDSGIYDEYPDREFLYWMRDQILQNAVSLGYAENQDLVMLLVLNEMMKRRALNR